VVVGFWILTYAKGAGRLKGYRRKSIDSQITVNTDSQVGQSHGMYGNKTDRKHVIKLTKTVKP